MSISKQINVNDGSGRVFEENTVSELKFDVKPEVGSFNAVTSDAVARAIAGASGEVPQVTENDNGKVLTASYDAGGPSVSWEDPSSTAVSTGGVMSGDGSAGNPVVLNYDTARSFKPVPMWGIWNYNFSISATGGITLPTETVINLFNGVPLKVHFTAPYTQQNYHWYIDDSSVTYTRGITRVVISKDGSDYVFVMQAVQGTDPAITLGTDGTYKGLFGNTDLYWTGAVNSLYSQGTAEYAISLLNEGGTAVLDWVPTDGLMNTPVTGLTYVCNYVAGMMFSGYAVRTGMMLELLGKTVYAPESYDIGKVLTVVNSNGDIGWRHTPLSISISTGTANIDRNNVVATSSVDVTSIVVGADVMSAVVQWTVASTTTLPTVTDSNNVALKASVNNPASLTVGRTVQVSILNGTWVCAEFA